MHVVERRDTAIAWFSFSPWTSALWWTLIPQPQILYPSLATTTLFGILFSNHRQPDFGWFSFSSLTFCGIKFALLPFDRFRSSFFGWCWCCVGWLLVKFITIYMFKCFKWRQFNGFIFLLVGVTILLSLTVFLNMVAETMPATSDAVPLLGKFSTTLMLKQKCNKKPFVYVLGYRVV